MFKRPNKGVKALFSVIIVICVIAYPFLVYFLTEFLSPRWFALFLLCLFVLRFLYLGDTKKFKDWSLLTLVAAFCVSVVLIDSQQLLKFYPVLMNVGMALLFFVSLLGKQSLIERFANMGKKKPPPEARPYLRRLNVAWGLLLLLNGLVSAYTAWYSTLSVWTLYNGVLSYLLIATFAAVEFVYRSYYKRKHGLIDE